MTEYQKASCSRGWMQQLENDNDEDDDDDNNNNDNNNI